MLHRSLLEWGNARADASLREPVFSPSMKHKVKGPHSPWILRLTSGDSYLRVVTVPVVSPLPEKNTAPAGNMSTSAQSTSRKTLQHPIRVCHLRLRLPAHDIPDDKKLMLRSSMCAAATHID